MTASFSLYLDLLAHGVYRFAATDQAKVRGCFQMEPAYVSSRYGLPGNLNRVDSLLGLNTGVCRFARDFSHERNQIRRPGRYSTSGTRTIQHKTEVTLDFGHIQVLGAFEDNLLGNGKDDLDVSVRDYFG